MNLKRNFLLLALIFIACVLVASVPCAPVVSSNPIFVSETQLNYENSEIDKTLSIYEMDDIYSANEVASSLLSPAYVSVSDPFSQNDAAYPNSQGFDNIPGVYSNVSGTIPSLNSPSHSGTSNNLQSVQGGVAYPSSPSNVQPNIDTNPFRYSGEYKDLRSGTYYLRPEEQPKEQET